LPGDLPPIHPSIHLCSRMNDLHGIIIIRIIIHPFIQSSIHPSIHLCSRMHDLQGRF
jgi:hypothetical protein